MSLPVEEDLTSLSSLTAYQKTISIDTANLSSSPCEYFQIMITVSLDTDETTASITADDYETAISTLDASAPVFYFKVTKRLEFEDIVAFDLTIAADVN